jgi:anti-sigma-K factor RskA
MIAESCEPMPSQPCELHTGLAVKIGVVATDVKYIRESLSKFDTILELITRHDVRISTLEQAEVDRKKRGDEKRQAIWNGWLSIRIALVSAGTIAILAMIKNAVEHYIFKTPPSQ